MTLLTAVMLILTENPQPFVFHQTYATYEACSLDLDNVDADAVCIDGEKPLAPTTSPRPRPNPFYGR